jgi:hypothetical protein
VLAGADPGPLAEHHDVEQRVGAEPVGPWTEHAGALAGRVQPAMTRVGGVGDHLGVDVGGMPPMA